MAWLIWFRSTTYTREDTDSIPWLGPVNARIGDINVTEQGVSKLLKDLKVHKASGPDKIPNRVLRELADEIAPVLTAVYNQSLSSDTTPPSTSGRSLDHSTWRRRREARWNVYKPFNYGIFETK